MQNPSQENDTPIPLKMPVDRERMIKVEDPVYSFNKLLRHIDLKRYLTGRPGHDGEKRFKVMLFAFMEGAIRP